MKWVKLTLLEANNIREALHLCAPPYPSAGKDEDEVLEALLLIQAAIENAEEEDIP